MTESSSMTEGQGCGILNAGILHGCRFFLSIQQKLRDEKRIGGSG